MFFSDYLQYRDAVKDVLNSKGWNSLNDDEKYLIIELALKEDSKTDEDSEAEKGYFLYINGDVDPKACITDCWARHHKKDKQACYDRGDSATMYDLVAYCLGRTQAETFYAVAKNLIKDYIEQGVKGLSDNSKHKGFFDWLEDTNGYESFGLSAENFVYTNDGGQEAFIESVMRILRLGEYES